MIGKRQKYSLVFLLAYLAAVLWFTVYRRPLRIQTAQLELLWSYKAWLAGDTNMGKQIVANVAMFVPFGFLLSAILPKRRFVIPAATVFSLIIELLQLVKIRGVFEWDDVISNTIGALVGMAVYLVLEKMAGKHLQIATISIGLLFAIICLVVVIRVSGRTKSVMDTTPKAYCLQVDDVSVADGRMRLEGFAFRYDQPTLDTTLLLRSVKGDVGLEMEKVDRSDVNDYFLCDCTDSGFVATGDVEEGQDYEVMIRWPLTNALSTGVFVSDAGVHYQPEGDYTPPDLHADFVDRGILRAYRPDYHCWVYQYDGALYWVVDQDFDFEDNGSVTIRCQLWTTRTDMLPPEQLEKGRSWDAIGGDFKENELEGDWGGYRVMKRELPTTYPITAIATGVREDDGKWIWRECFWPHYDFRH